MAEKRVTLKAKAGAAPGFPGFVGWLAATHPKLYNMVLVSDPDTVMMLESRHASGARLGELPDVSPAATVSQPPVSGSALTQFVQTVAQAGAAVLPLIQQQKVLNLQLQRAKAGLPPLDVGAYIDPNSGFNVGVTPATQKVLLWLGGGALGAFLLSRVLGRR